MILTLVKTRKFDIKPFGNFVFKWKKNKLYDARPNWLWVGEMNLEHDSAMPLSEEDEARWVKEMKKEKTDIYVDDSGHTPIFYTRTNSRLTTVSHKRLTNYYNFSKLSLVE